MPAEFLKIQVSRQGVTVANLSFPAMAVANLGGLVPEPVAKRLLADGLNPQEIGERTAASGHPAGELFRNDDGCGKVVRVWLE